MIVVTTPDVPGRQVERVLGLVRGNTIRTRHLGHDIQAAFRNIAGGEVREYTKMLAEAREQAVDRMIEEADALGADAVVAVRFQTCEVMKGAAEMLCYGTAVVLASVA
ncbi:MAG: YbjQ family protein [Longimicrobiales bacterium]|nr:YbjQ family protein [Longimicrobiales bacterium]